MAACLLYWGLKVNPAKVAERLTYDSAWCCPDRSDIEPKRSTCRGGFKNGWKLGAGGRAEAVGGFLTRRGIHGQRSCGSAALLFPFPTPQLLLKRGWISAALTLLAPFYLLVHADTDITVLSLINLSDQGNAHFKTPSGYGSHDAAAAVCKLCVRA